MHGERETATSCRRWKWSSTKAGREDRKFGPRSTDRFGANRGRHRMDMVRYAGGMGSQAKAGEAGVAAGLCADCLHARRVESERGSVFVMCQLSVTDASFPKYPRLPVLSCAGYLQKDKPQGSEDR